MNFTQQGNSFFTMFFPIHWMKMCLIVSLKKFGVLFCRFWLIVVFSVAENTQLPKILSFPFIRFSSNQSPLKSYRFFFSTIKVFTFSSFTKCSVEPLVNAVVFNIISFPTRSVLAYLIDSLAFYRTKFSTKVFGFPRWKCTYRFFTDKTFNKLNVISSKQYKTFFGTKNTLSIFYMTSILFKYLFTPFTFSFNHLLKTKSASYCLNCYEKAIQRALGVTVDNKVSIA